MRKFVQKGLFVTGLMLFSAQLLADVTDCALQLKGNKDYKGLYGLCVAYWNADEHAQDRLFDLYVEKAARLGVPDDLMVPPGYETDDVTCPCWDIELVRQVFACDGYMFAGGYVDVEVRDGEFQSEVAFLSDSYFPLLVVGPTLYSDQYDGNECQLVGADPAMIEEPAFPVDPGQERACRDDIAGLIATLPSPGDCEF